MSKNKVFTGDQIDITKISIKSERFKNQFKELIVAGKEVQAPTAVELNVYENINKPYLSGNLILQDDNDLYFSGDFKGTERIIFEYISAGDDDAPIERTFVITNIEKSVKTTDQSTLLKINFIENHAYFSDLKLVNKSYTGTPPEIIKKIIEDNTTLSVNDISAGGGAIQRSLRYIVPWQSALDACYSVLTKSSTTDGLPFFLYSTLNSKEIVLTDLETILSEKPWNDKNPFTYSKALMNKSNDDIINKQFIIYNYSASNLEETKKYAKLGAIGSSISHVDADTGLEVSGRLDMLKEFNSLERREIFKDDQKRAPIDEDFRAFPDGPEDIKLNDYNSRRFTSFSFSPFRDVNGLVSDFLNARQLIIKNNFFRYLYKNIHKIHVPGVQFTTRDLRTTVGNQIQIELLGSALDETKSTETTDKKRSGNYIMLAKRHIFDIVNEAHSCAISVGRIADERLLS